MIYQRNNPIHQLRHATVQSSNDFSFIDLDVSRTKLCRFDDDQMSNPCMKQSHEIRDGHALHIETLS